MTRIFDIIAMRRDRARRSPRTAAILILALLSFTLSMDDVMVNFFVTGPTLEIPPLKIYSMARLDVTPEINALWTIMLGKRRP